MQANGFRTQEVGLRAGWQPPQAGSSRGVGAGSPAPPVPLHGNEVLWVILAGLGGRGAGLGLRAGAAVQVRLRKLKVGRPWDPRLSW